MSIDAERAMCPLVNSDNFHIVYSRQSSFTKTLDSNNLYIANEKIVNSYELLEDDKVMKFIHSFDAKKVFVNTFKISPRFGKLVEQSGFSLLTAESSISKNIENKFLINEYVNDIYLPTYQILNIDGIMKFKSKSVIQLAFGHTGNGTFIIEGQSDLEKVKNHIKGSKVKYSKYIDGVAVNINSCILNNSTFVFGLNEQISHPCLAPNSGITTGNDYSLKNLNNDQKEYVNLHAKLIALEIAVNLKSNGYKGFFGIDFIFDKANNKLYVIEINARQTANVSIFEKLFVAEITSPSEIFYFDSIIGIENLPEVNTASVEKCCLIRRNYTVKSLKYSFPRLSDHIYISNLGKIEYGDEMYRLYNNNEYYIAEQDYLCSIISNIDSQFS